MQIGRVAQFLREGSVGCVRILHSGKTRASQTAELLAVGLQGSQSIEAVSNLNPNDPVEEWIPRADSWNEDTLLVGHMPFMGNYASRLIDPQGLPR